MCAILHKCVCERQLLRVPASPRENRLAQFVHRIRLANELEVILMRKSFLAILFLLLALPLVADEGMWLFNRTPNAIFKQRYGFEPTKAWLDHLQKSSIRFNSGGSGAFVSAGGGGVERHHRGLGCLAEDLP